MNHITKLQENLLTAVQTSPYREKTIVFGEGAEAPLLMMIGEAPGGDEEKQGRPFVGKAGKNLSAFLEVVGLKREASRTPHDRQIRQHGRPEPPSFQEESPQCAIPYEVWTPLVRQRV